MVVSASRDLIVNYEDCADRNFTGVTRQPGFIQCEAHKEPIIRVGILKKIGYSAAVCFSVCRITLCHCLSGAPKREGEWYWRE